MTAYVATVVWLLIALDPLALALAARSIIPDERAALIAFKALGYDDSDRGESDEFGLVVLHFSPETRARAERVQATLVEARRRSRGTETYWNRGEPILMYGDSPLDVELRSRSARLLYLVTDGDVPDAAVSQIQAAADREDVIVFADDVAYLGRCAALSVELIESDGSSRVQICADLSAASEQGGQFAAEFLRLCRVVKR